MHVRPAVIALVSFILVATSVRAEEDPQKIVDRAIQAVGGASRLGRARAYEMKMTGVVYSQTGDKLPFQAHAFTQLPDQFKHVMVYERNGTKITQTQVYAGAALGVRINDQVWKVDPALRDALMKGRFADHLTQLTVIKAKDHVLTALGESKVEGRPVLGVKVVAPERPEVQLFFDRESGLLVKTEHRQPDTRVMPADKEVVQEVFYADYQVCDVSAADEKRLKDAKLKTDDAALIELLLKRAGGGDRREKIQTLVRQLGDDAFEKREQASTELAAMGADAIPFLKDALKSTDLEVVRRAQECLKKIGTGSARKEDAELAVAAARVLAARKTAGAAEALLAFLVSGPEETVAREVRAALAVVAFTDGKADPALLKAAEGKDPVRRAAAEEALGRLPLPAGRKIFLDGLKRPTKIAVYRAGRKFMEWQLTEISYFNKFDDKTFMMP